MLDLIIRRMYFIWSSVLLFTSGGICIAFLCGMHFEYYKTMFYLQIGLAALPFFFGVRLFSGTNKSKFLGAVIITVSLLLMAFGVYRIAQSFVPQVVL